jgi:hypothetical protein
MIILKIYNIAYVCHCEIIINIHNILINIILLITSTIKITNYKWQLEIALKIFFISTVKKHYNMIRIFFT